MWFEQVQSLCVRGLSRVRPPGERRAKRSGERAERPETQASAHQDSDQLQPDEPEVDR